MKHHIKNILNIALDQVGFSSFSELFQNAIAWKHKVTTIYVLGVSLSGMLIGLESFTDKYIYTPALGILILFLVTVIDIVLGISVSIEQRAGLSGQRLGRAMIRFVIQVVFTALLFQMSMTWHYLIYSWMVDSMLIIFSLSTFYSALQNAAKLGLITADQYGFIESIVNIKELINRIKSKK